MTTLERLTVLEPIVLAIQRRMQHYGITLDPAMRLVAKDHDISITTVERAWRTFWALHAKIS